MGAGAAAGDVVEYGGVRGDAGGPGGARAHFEAEAVLAAGCDADAVHEAWRAASERAVAWTDLVAEAMWGQRRVPQR
ncbi:hypothetical protein [Nocardia sp. NPDC059239]|uniref:hypothetical protein n=1 Tax=Nocardia sp. NPDC059239 TaxID=3346785 RepID=UPI0036B90C6F